MITNEALRILVNNLVTVKKFNRQYDSSFGVAGAKIGTTLNVRKPVQYVGGEGPALTIEDITETLVPVVLNRQPLVGISFTSADLKLSIDDFSKRLISPAVANIANKVDAAGNQLSQLVWNTVGPAQGATPGVTPTDFQPWLQSQVKLNNNATPMDGQRNTILTPLMEATVTYGLRTLFQSSQQIKEQYEKGTMGRAAGYDWSMDQNVFTQTIGALGTAADVLSQPTMSTLAGQTGNSIATIGWDHSITNILNTGDVFQIAGVHLVNPQSRQSTGQLQDFVVAAPVSSDGSGNATITFNPPITVSGAYQTVDSAPAASAALTIYGVAGTGVSTTGLSTIAGVQSPQSLGFHPDAFTLACADLPLPEGVDMAARASDKDLGLALRMVRAYDIMSDQFPCRVDLLFGVAALRPQLAVRIPG
jgi:hypothetical protein